MSDIVKRSVAAPPGKNPPNSYADDPKKGGYRPSPMKPDPKIKVK